MKKETLAAIINFFFRVEEVPVPEKPEPHELVDGKAFTIKHYPLQRAISLCPEDTLTAIITEDGEAVGKVQEAIHMCITVDTISTIRFNDALGYKHAFGALFGQRNKKE